MTSDDLPGFIQELTNTTTENDCSGIELCILLPQDILEDTHINKIKSFSEYLHSIGFKMGLYLLGSRYIHNGCHTHGIFDRFVMKSQYAEHSITSGSHLKYCVDTLNVLHKFVDSVSIPSKVQKTDIDLMLDAGVQNFSYNLEPVTGAKALVDDFKKRDVVTERVAEGLSRVSELNPTIAYHDILKSNMVWLFYDVRKKSFSISPNAVDVLGDNLLTDDGLLVENLRDRIHPDDTQGFNEALTELRMNQGVVSFDARIRLQKDSADYSHLRTTIICATDASGAPIRFQCAITKLS